MAKNGKANELSIVSIETKNRIFPLVFHFLFSKMSQVATHSMAADSCDNVCFFVLFEINLYETRFQAICFFFSSSLCSFFRSSAKCAHTFSCSFLIPARIEKLKTCMRKEQKKIEAKTHTHTHFMEYSLCLWHCQRTAEFNQSKTFENAIANECKQKPKQNQVKKHWCERDTKQSETPVLLMLKRRPSVQTNSVFS